MLLFTGNADWDGVVFMRNKNRSGLVIVISAIAAIIAAIVASTIVLFEKRKRDDEELDQYLEGSIQ